MHDATIYRQHGVVKAARIERITGPMVYFSEKGNINVGWPTIQRCKPAVGDYLLMYPGGRFEVMGAEEFEATHSVDDDAEAAEAFEEKPAEEVNTIQEDDAMEGEDDTDEPEDGEEE